ncbi:MAG: chemotaxis-specific protein-glutamate methyltransferase CheB [Pseudomonadota bacterium]
MNAHTIPIRGEHQIGTGGHGTVRVMIVDDSLTVRTVFKRMIDGAPRLKTAGTASSGEQALSQLRRCSDSDLADVILLDVEMPGMGGLKALPAILETAPKAKVLVVSSLTQDGAETTISALSMGAADTMLKPRPGGFNDEYCTQLLEKIYALGEAQPDLSSSSRTKVHRNSNGSPTSRIAASRPELLAIGASTGGIHALNILLRNLSPAFDCPILITQHLPSSFISVFARQVELISGRKTVIAERGTTVRNGEIAVATGHGHMVIEKHLGEFTCRISTDPADSGCLPSVDPMLSSIAKACEGNAVAIILSGMGRDGLEGARDLVNSGGVVFAQDTETSAVWGMPGAVAKAGLTSLIGSPEQLAEVLNVQCGA